MTSLLLQFVERHPILTFMVLVVLAALVADIVDTAIVGKVAP